MATSKGNAWAATRTKPGAQHHPATEGNADPTRALHAVQGLFATSGAAVQAQPSGRVAYHQDHSERAALDVVAGRAVTPNLSTSRPISILPGGRFWITFSFSECCWGQPCWTVNLNGSVPRFCATWWRRRMTPSSKNGF